LRDKKSGGGGVGVTGVAYREDFYEFCAWFRFLKKGTNPLGPRCGPFKRGLFLGPKN
jgi:hypothetical protein